MNKYDLFKEKRDYTQVFDKTTFDERTKVRLKLIRQGYDLDYIIRYVYVSKNYSNIKINIYNCLIHYFYILAKLKRDYKAANILFSYSNTKNKEIFKFREKMIKENMPFIEIEKVINNKYNIDLDITSETQIKVINTIYELIKLYNNMFKKGRPMLSNEEKIEKRDKNRLNMKEVMKNKYQKLNKYQSNLFTKTEKDYLLSLNLSNDIKKKIEVFS